MNAMRRSLLIIIFAINLLVLSISVMAQQTERPEVALVARSYADHIDLRYYPTTASLFNRGNKVGYIVEKAIKVKGKLLSQLSFQQLKGSPFKPWTDDKWQSAFESIDQSDTTQLQLAAFAMGFTNPNAVTTPSNVMENDLQSLKESSDNAENNFSFVMLATSRSKLAAEGCGLRVSDKDVIKGSMYVYRIRLNDQGKANWTYVEILCADFKDTYLRNDRAVVLNEGDRMINFTFPKSNEYFAYNVFRSGDGSTYMKITDAPSVRIKPEGYEGPMDFGFNDSGLINYKKYHYRVTVITPFADEMVLSEFTAIPKDKTPPTAPFLRSAEHIAPKKVQLTWEILSNSDNDIKGFIVSRSNDEKGGYKPITQTLLPVTTTTFVDETFTTDGTNFYVVDAIDSAGNIGRSFPAYVTLIDSTPPAVPVISSAVIDSLGKVIIKVQPNTEKDFMGYQLLKANAAEHEFSVVEETYKDSLGATTFVLSDSTTLKSLTRNIYYKLIAFDTHFNQSQPSRIIQLARRDTIPPVSPLITDYTITDSSVQFQFVNSESEDVARNILLRRVKGKLVFDSVFSNSDTTVTFFVDSKITPGETYEYAMVATDQGGLTSKLSNTIILKTLSNTRLPSAIVSVEYNKDERTVLLQIKTDPALEGKKVNAEIYRSIGNGEWRLIQTLDITKGKIFTDKNIDNKTETNYSVRLIDSSGKQSNFSNEARVIF